jgi:hypothetical protein
LKYNSSNTPKSHRMKYHSRELLVTTKAAQQWQNNFDRHVDMLMAIVSKVDNDQNVRMATELMDVYHTAPLEATRKKNRKAKPVQAEKPFEFVVFRN